MFNKPQSPNLQQAKPKHHIIQPGKKMNANRKKQTVLNVVNKHKNPNRKQAKHETDMIVERFPHINDPGTADPKIHTGLFDQMGG